MPATLLIGSAGPLVSDLQKKLNMLPTILPLLKVDGVFGSKTRSRVQEFQGGAGLTPDGVVGPVTWDQLLQLISGLTGDFQNNLGRMAVVAIAKAEAGLGGVFAKQSGGIDPADSHKRSFRMGYRRLLKYFRVAAPKPGAVDRSETDEDVITHLITPGELAPMPHWCGIFALWAIKAAGMPVGTWKTGGGMGQVSGFRGILPGSIGPGDVGFVAKPFQHHFLIDQVFVEGGIRMVTTIEGNSSPSSNFSFKTRRVSEISAFLTCF